jgi:hypothetical protein
MKEETKELTDMLAFSQFVEAKFKTQDEDEFMTPVVSQSDLQRLH